MAAPTAPTIDEIEVLIKYSSFVDEHNTLAKPEKGSDDHEISIEVDHDSSLHYEKMALARRILNFLVLFPTMRLLARFSRIGVSIFSLSHACRSVRKYATGHRALEIIYTYPWKNLSNRPLVDRLASMVFFNILNAKAVRNRRRLVQKEIKSAINNSPSREVLVASLGSGSARPVLEAISQLDSDLDSDKDVQAMLVDADRSAIRYSKSLAKRFDLYDQMSWHRGIIKKFLTELEHTLRDFSGTVVFEMVGIIDYLPDKAVLGLFNAVKSRMLPGDVFVTCNIAPNPEEAFMNEVIGWKMDYYRTPEQLCQLAKDAKLDFSFCKIIGEPVGLHWILVCRVGDD